jgi:hypothetical protein
VGTPGGSPPARPRSDALGCRSRHVRGEGVQTAAQPFELLRVTAVRYQGIIHDFVMLNALRETAAADAAIAQASAVLRAALAPSAH